MGELFRMPYPVLFATSLAVSAGLTPAFRWLALRSMVFVQRPKAISIETHVRPIPVGGGLAIFLGVVAALWLNRSWSPLEQRILLGAGLLSVFGLLDDSRVLKLRSRLLSNLLLDNRALSAQSKLVGQFLVASFVVLAAGWGGPLEVPHLVSWQWVNQAVAIVWIVGMMNAINFLDIMDGLAAGTSAVAALGFFFLAGVTGMEPALAAISIALAGSAFGFLFYNFQPARVFMGDTGSQFFGLVLGVLALQGASSPTTAVSVLSSLVLVGIFLFEITFTVGMRLLAGKNPMMGSKDHYPLRMFQLGLSVRRIVAASYLAGGGLALLALWLARGSMPERLAALLILGIAVVIVTRWLSRVKVPEIPVRVERPAASGSGEGLVRESGPPKLKTRLETSK